MNSSAKPSHTHQRPSLVVGILLVLSLPIAITAVTPTLYSLVWGVCGTGNPGELGRLTTHWLAEVMVGDAWMSSIVFSLCLSVAACTCSLMLIVLGDYFSRLSASAYERVSDSLILAVLIFPQVIYGLALRHVLGISSVPGIVLLTLGNVVLLMPVQYMVLQAAYGHLLNSQLHAATVLGASVLAGITRVYLPLMWRPVVAAWCIGAVIAFDELVIAMFLWDGTVEPVSKRLWQLFGRSADPIPGAITLIVVFLIVIVIAFALLLRAYLTRSARHQT